MKNYVKTYKGHDVPDGATHYNADNMLWPEAFYNINNGTIARVELGCAWLLATAKLPTTAIELPLQDLPNWDEQTNPDFVWITDLLPEVSSDLTGWYELLGGEYVSTTFKNCKISMNSPSITVHKRPIAIEDKEWLPAVGEECEFKYAGDWFRCVLVGNRLDGRAVYENVDEDITFTSQGYTEFRPLKTAEEKEEEYNLCYLRGLHPTVYGISADKIQDYLNDYTALLVKAGVTAPKDGN